MSRTLDFDNIASEIALRLEEALPGATRSYDCRVPRRVKVEFTVPDGREFDYDVVEHNLLAELRRYKCQTFVALPPIYPNNITSPGESTNSVVPVRVDGRYNIDDRSTLVIVTVFLHSK